MHVKDVGVCLLMGAINCGEPPRIDRYRVSSTARLILWLLMVCDADHKMALSSINTCFIMHHVAHFFGSFLVFFVQ